MLKSMYGSKSQSWKAALIECKQRPAKKRPVKQELISIFYTVLTLCKYTEID
ncbi:hypothetical protein HOLleu_14067 [Holothuria leucospilota]|uniref:Uncharacterized protein n=1 Tax=Holothuria leucospilota TaxID=206669 RepID=A0A9Q1HBF3_HOLLE|nr:hypothetical protein HOLleu_14067 [Holothuria leucospilota]